MVLIHNEGSRLHLRLASSDGEVRGAKVETVTSGYKSVIQERSLQLLYSLEVLHTKKKR